MRVWGVVVNACHQAILGQTLTSDTSANGGSLAQAEVHMGVQKSVVMTHAGDTDAGAEVCGAG